MAITFKNISFTYFPNTPFSHQALIDVNLKLPLGQIYCLIGDTGSGKSTLVQLINGLMSPTSGEVEIKFQDKEYVVNKKGAKKQLRKDVGLVFQFPEYQLFEETIIDDVAFGPLNFGATKEEAKKIAAHWLTVCGIKEDYFLKSPFELSGGQKRRVAIAGILALDPQVLILDEPTAGLDPQGAVSMMKLFTKLNKELGKTVIIISHDLDMMLEHVDEFILLKKGQIIAKGKPQEFFNQDIVKENVRLPLVYQAVKLLNNKGITINQDIRNVKELAKIISEVHK